MLVARVTRRSIAGGALLGAILGLSGGVVAQTPPPAGAAVIQPARAGECAVLVRLSEVLPEAPSVQLELNKMPLATKTVGTRRMVAVSLGGPLQAGDVLRARVRAPNQEEQAWGAATTVTPGDVRPDCGESRGAVTDQRDAFSSTGYVGWRVITFSPDRRVGQETKVRVSGGIDFETRLSSRWQLWLGGRSIYGGKTVKEGDSLPEPTDTTDIIASATALDGDLFMRWEFATLQGDTASPTRLYAIARYGITWLTNFEDSAAATTGDGMGEPGVLGGGQPETVGGFLLLGAGVRAVDGPLAGSYVEGGFGFTSVLSGLTMKRLKADTFITVDPFRRWRVWGGLPRFFIQIQVDVDPSSGNLVRFDEILTRFGVTVDVSKLY